MPLFTPEQLTSWLQYQVEDASAQMAEQVVAGWLSGATGLEAWPEPLPPVLFSWAIELGGIAYENPTSMTDDQAGETRSAWADRKRQILLDARLWGERRAGTSSTPAPTGSFPAAPSWPERLGWR